VAIPAAAHGPGAHRHPRHRARQARTLLTPEQKRLLDALTDQGALAIERVHLVEDIDRVQRTAETDRLRAALLTSISHDLKTPLAGVLGAAGALRDLSASLDASAKADLVATIIEESERLNRFIANLLDMTRLEAGAVVPNAALHDLGEIVGSALERARKILAKHRLEVAMSADLPMLSVDAVLFEQVLFNVLDNAAKYAPPDTTIRIQSWRDAKTAGLQILDEGAGIPQEDLERIFDKFYRVRKGDQVRAGTGLGLAISRGFIEALHGTITAANRTDRSGAVFTIALPIPHTDRDGRLPHERAGQNPGRRRRAAHSQAAAHRARAQGYEVLDAPSGKAALELLARKPDLVILDLGLPDIDGLELLRRIRKLQGSLPIVVLSSRGDEAGKVAALDLGADDYVTKPFGMDELLARMRAALRHQLQVHGEQPIFRVGDLSVDLVRRIVRKADKEVKLSPKEYDLLRLLVQHAGKVLTHKFCCASCGTI
jgi:signal transduction histidine kinase/DNA-binding response OmpR family regulator